MYNTCDATEEGGDTPTSTERTADQDNEVESRLLDVVTGSDWSHSEEFSVKSNVMDSKTTVSSYEEAFLDLSNLVNTIKMGTRPRSGGGPLEGTKVRAEGGNVKTLLCSASEKSLTPEPIGEAPEVSRAYAGPSQDQFYEDDEEECVEGEDASGKEEKEWDNGKRKKKGTDTKLWT